MSSPLSRVHHIALSVADIAKSVQWYTTSFDCEVLDQQKQFAILQFENLKLVLTLPSLDPPHTAFERPDAEKYGEIRPRVDGVQSTFVADNSGNMIEIVKV